MWLQYALGKDNNLVSVHDCPRGRSEIRCPYCQGELTAKKGKVKAHHFAHINETCNRVSFSTSEWKHPAMRGVASSDALGAQPCVGKPDRFLASKSPELPLYDRFDLGVEPKILKILIDIWEKKTNKNPSLNIRGRGEHLEELGVVNYNSYRNNGRGSYEFSKLGLLAVGGLSLMLFNQVQDSLIIAKLDEIEENLLDQKDFLPESGKPAYGTSIETEKQILQEITIDYQIYLLTLRRILSNSLYFLEIKADGEIYHKIGITTRDIAARILEIKQDLGKHFSTVSIKGLGFWLHRGNVEYYFKYR
ncbi:competence protein CoiA family protein [Pleurocapsa sp. FMAR1]|uniref:competence protein CoiA family protein n=1 Tax=Pleurocapsa sp. FMAR1 TaxID=3040204 RepID=UPI0029C7F80B|nr:hypothetical protein [Pleurocapsa sp. FMAR1]